MRISGLLVLQIILFALTQGIYGQKFNESTGEDALTGRESNPSKKMEFPSEIKITSIEDMPYSGLMMENGSYVGRGYAFYLFELIRSKLNFTYKIVPPKTNVLGNHKTGILSQLYNKEVDMAVAFIPVFPEMLQYGSFSMILDEVAMTVLMKRPQESATGSGLLAPFDRTVWYLVLASVIVVGPTIYLFVLIRSKLLNENSEKYSFLTCMWFVYGALLKQGSTVSAVSDSTRLLFATWWMFILILTSFYTANLTAFLTRPQFTLPIQCLEDVVKHGYQWATFGGRSVDFLLAQTGETEVSELRKLKYKGKYIWNYNHPETEILNIVNRGSVFLGESHFLQGLLLRDYLNKTAKNVEHADRCTYVIMPGNIFVKGHAFGFPFNSTIQDYINEELINIIQSGLIRHFKDVDVPIAEICPVDLRSTERRLRNTDLLLTYIVIGVGFTIAALIFAYELILKHLPRHKKRSGKNQRFGWFCCRRKALPEVNRQSVVPVHTVFDKANSPGDIAKKNPAKFMQNVEKNPALGRKQCINGRDYYIVMERNGERRLIPIRTPSAYLFHYVA